MKYEWLMWTMAIFGGVVLPLGLMYLPEGSLLYSVVEILLYPVLLLGPFGHGMGVLPVALFGAVLYGTLGFGLVYLIHFAGKKQT